MPNYWSSKLFSVGFDDQTAYDKKDGGPSYTWIQCELPDVSFNREIEEFELGASTDGVASDFVAGSTHGGTVTLRMPIRGQASGYDATGAMTENPEMKLIKELIGTSVVKGYADGQGVESGSDANTAELTAGSADVGAFQAWGDTGTKALHLAGWVKSQAGTTVTLFEDSIVSAMVDTSDLLPSTTIYPNGGQPTAKTIAIRGSHSTQSLVLIGCIPESGSISLENGKVPVFEVTYRFTAYEYDTSDGGLQSATAYTRLSPILGTSYGRVWFGGGNAADDGAGAQAGTANTEGTCGIGSFKLDIALDVYEIPCHGSAQGVSTVHVSKRNFTASFTIPALSTHVDATTKDSIFGVSLAQEKGYSLTVQVGKKAGELFAMIIPAAVVTSQPDWGEVDGIQSYTLELQPKEWSGDGSSSDAGNSPFRLAFA